MTRKNTPRILAQNLVLGDKEVRKLLEDHGLSSAAIEAKIRTVEKRIARNAARQTKRRMQ